MMLCLKRNLSLFIGLGWGTNIAPSLVTFHAIRFSNFQLWECLTRTKRFFSPFIEVRANDDLDIFLRRTVLNALRPPVGTVFVAFGRPLNNHTFDRDVPSQWRVQLPNELKLRSEFGNRNVLGFGQSRRRNLAENYRGDYHTSHN